MLIAGGIVSNYSYSTKFKRIGLAILTGFTLLFYQNCGKSFQAEEFNLSQAVDQASSIDDLPPVNVFNGELDLMWDKTTLNEDNSAASLKGYKIYIGNSSKSYSTTINENVVGNFTDHRITGLVSKKTYYLAVSAVSKDGIESNMSTELVYTAP